MSGEIMLVFGEDGVAREYDDAWDITIHCESEEEQKAVLEKIKNSNQEAKAQLSAEGTTSDLISRQDAIEVVEHITSSMSVCVNTDECHGMKRMQRQAVIELANLPSAQPQYEELTPEEAASELASESTMSAWYWLNDMIRLKQMGYAICRKR